MPTLEWRIPANPKVPSGKTFPLVEQAPVLSGSYVVLQGRGFANTDDFFLYHSYMRAIQASLESKGLPKHHVHSEPYPTRHPPNSPDTIRTEFTRMYRLHDRPRWNQAVGFKTQKGPYSRVVNLCGERVYWKRLRKLRVDGGFGPIRAGLEFGIAAPRDPELELELLLPWQQNPDARPFGPQTVLDVLQDETEAAATDLGIDGGALWEAVRQNLDLYLPSEMPRGWNVAITNGSTRYLDAGEEGVVNVEFDCPEDGAVAFSLKATDVSVTDNPEEDNYYITSEVIALVVEDQEVSLLFTDDSYELVVEQAIA